MYTDLASLSAAQDGALFPFAVTAHREGWGPSSTRPHCLFVFERPKCASIAPLLGGPALAVSLRRHGELIRLWASQFGKVYYCLKRKEAGMAINMQISTDDIFVREVG